MDIQPFIYGHSGAFSTREKKWNRDKTFYLLPILKTYKVATFCLTPMPHTTHLLLLSHFGLTPSIFHPTQQMHKTGFIH